MPERKSRRRRAATPGQSRQRMLDVQNPRYSRVAGRTGRIPRTLIDASTAANAAAGLRVFAAAIHFDRPCWAQTLERYAAQIAAGYTEAQAVAGMTDTPTASAGFIEGTFTEGASSEMTFSENEAQEPGV